MEQTTSQKIDIVKSDAAMKYIDQIDCSDAEPWLFDEVSENGEGLYAICLADTVIGFAYIEDEPHGFLYVYIFPVYRNKGYGDMAVTAMEQQIKASPLICMMTTYHSDCTAAIHLAEKHEPFAVPAAFRLEIGLDRPGQRDVVPRVFESAE